MPNPETNLHSTRRAAKQRWSLRSRLMILSLLAIAPLFADRVRLLENRRAERVETASAEAIDLARRARDTQVGAIEATRTLLRAAAHTYAVLTTAGKDCGTMLASLTAGSPVGSLSVVGGNDRIVCSTRPQAVGLDVSDRDYVREARRSGGFVLSDYIVDRSPNASALMAAYPVSRPADEIDVVLLAPIDLDRLSRLGESIGRPGAAAYLIVANGAVLAGLHGAERVVGKRRPDHPLVRHVATRQEGTVTLEGLDGVRRVFGFSQIPGTDARIVVGFDEREMLHRIDREAGLAYLQLALFGLLTMLAAALLGEHLVVEPIRALSRAAARIGQGHLVTYAVPRSWAPEFVPLATALADMAEKLAAREADLRAANEHLRELASIDALSGLANRRSFDTRLDAAWRHAGEAREPLGLMMVDVDHFKLFNDCYGHVAGDACLRRVATAITQIAAPETDVAARYGGEEFAVLIPAMCESEALARAEHLRRAVADLGIRNAHAPGGMITVSIGVAVRAPVAGEPAERLVEAADRSLYEAKRRGRNGVVVNGDLAHEEPVRDARDGSGRSVDRQAAIMA